MDKDSIKDLQSGEIDSIVYDNAFGTAIRAENPQFKIIDDKSDLEEYGIIVRKGNTELLKKINAALQKFAVDGTLENIKKKYLGF